MENEHILDAGASSHGNQLSISPVSSAYLKEIRKWASFLAIAGFCFIGLLVLIGISAGTILSLYQQEQNLPFPPYLLGVFYIALGVIYFFPVLYLFNFTRHLRRALASGSTHDLDAAFENLKSHYKYIGIFIIIFLIVYALVFIGMVLTPLIG